MNISANPLLARTSDGAHHKERLRGRCRYYGCQYPTVPCKFLASGAPDREAACWLDVWHEGKVAQVIRCRVMGMCSLCLM